MNVETIARRAGAELRAAVEPDTAASYTDFQRLVVRRRRRHTMGVAALAAVLLLLAVGLSQWHGPTSTPTPQPSRPLPSHSPSPVHDDGCDTPQITCLGNRTYRVALDVDMTWRLPPAFDAPYSGDPPTPSFIESYLTDRRAGVTVMHHVSAAALGATPRGRSDVATAEQFAQWLSTRPYLTAGRVEQVMVGDRRAWSVRVVVPPDAPDGPATCNQTTRCYPVIFQTGGASGSIAGTWAGMTSRYLALDLHGSGITVVWAWNLDGSTIPAPVQRAVDSIRFD